MGARVEASHESDTTKQQAQSDTTTKTTFDPRADDVIKNLSGGLSTLGTGNSDDAANYYRSMLSPAGGGVNPYAQQVVDSQDKLAEGDFNRRLSGVRSSGMGGGIGRDLIDQGMFASDFTNKQHAWNAQTLLDAFNTQQGRQFDSAGALGNIDQAKYATAINFINSLRGQQTSVDSSGRSDTTSTKLLAEAGAGKI